MDKFWSVCLRAFHLMYIVAPLGSFAFYYAFAWRASILIGRWPIPMIDHPKHFGDDDFLSVQLRNAADSFLGCCVFLFLFSLPFVASVFEGNFSARYRKRILWGAAFAWLVLPFLDFGGVGAWILD